MLERRVEFSLLTNTVEDGGSTFVELAQISQPLFEPTQLSVIEPSGRLLPVAGNKGHGRSAIEQRDGSSDRTPSSSAMRRSIGFIDSELFFK
jgi:hypothetical protein